MECKFKNELEQHLSNVRILSARPNLTSEEARAAARAEQFAIALLKQHDASGHSGKPCPLATLI